MKFPSIVLGLKTPVPNKGLAATSQFLTRLGDALGVPLVIQQTELKGGGRAIQCNFGDPSAARLLSDVQIVAVEHEKWVLIGSHREVMEQLLMAESSSSRAKRWQTGFAQAEHGYGWLDLEKLGKQIRTILGFYRLKTSIRFFGRRY